MKQFIIPFIACLLVGCFSFDRKQEVHITDEDFVEFSRLISPDSTMTLLDYGIDQGAMGYGHGGTAVLKLSDTTQNLRKFTLPGTLSRFKWINNKEISAQFDIIPSVRRGESLTLRDTVVNGIVVKISSYDYIEANAKQIIVHREASPNGQFELVAYRYINDERNLSFIHVSIIPTGQQIPKYGNYLIGDLQSDYVLNGTWSKDNTLIFYSNNLYEDLVQYYLVYNRPDINYTVVNEDKTYFSRYRWIGQIKSSSK